jgi:antitoxin FitA
VPVNLSVKSVPDSVAERLRRRAARKHRSLQGELLAILTAAAEAEGLVTAAELLTHVRRLGLSTPAEAADIVRRDRDGR